MLSLEEIYLYASLDLFFKEALDVLIAILRSFTVNLYQLFLNKFKNKKVLPTGKSHDVFTKHLLLNSSLDDDKRLWKSIKPFLREYGLN